MNSKFGRRLRLGIITAAVVSYPIVSLLLNGPLLNRSFTYFHKVDTKLPVRVDTIAKEV